MSAEANTPVPQSHTLPCVLGPFSAVAVVVGSIIGSGIFLKPGVVAENVPYVGLIVGVWVAMGLTILCGALALAELAAMLPHAGGPYVYLREAYGRLPAFLWGWTEFWVIRTGSLGALAAATAIYLSEFLVHSGRRPLELFEQGAISIFIVVGMSAINAMSTRWGAGVQNVTAVIKAVFLAALIVLPFVKSGTNVENLHPLLPETGASVGLWKGLGLAMIAVLWPYDGWINIGPVAEEIHNPQRNVPLALMCGMCLVIVLYVLVNVSYHLVLPVREVATSHAVAADVCVPLLGNIGAQIVALGVMCSTFGAVNSNLITGPRIYFAMARDGALPAIIHRVHPTRLTPMNAIIAQAVWTVLLIAGAYFWTYRKALAGAAAAAPDPRDAFDSLTDFVVFGGYIFYALAVGAVFVLRRTQPDLPRPYRTWGYPVTPALYLAAFSALLLYQLASKPDTSMAGLGLIAAGGVFYYAWNRLGFTKNA